MKINFNSKTLSGRLAIGLGIVQAAVSALELLFAGAIGGDSAVIAGNPSLAVLANALSITFSLAAPLSLFIGIYTAIKHKEWSIWKPLSILYVLAAAMFLFGEFLFSQ